jgi:molybdenum cofactor cytidylyltransferase
VTIAAIILAAGSSSRLGRPKQQVVLGGETLVERSVRIAKEARLSPIIVVVRPELDSDQSLQQIGIIIARNDHASEGLAASIRCGVQVANQQLVDGLLLMTCDQVAVTAEHLRALCAETGVVTGSGYAGKIGVPAFFPASSFEELLQLQGDTGARWLLRTARSVNTEDLAFDIDTEDDVTRATEHFGSV